MTPLPRHSTRVATLLAAVSLASITPPALARAQLAPSAEVGYRQWTRPERTAAAPVAALSIGGAAWRGLELSAAGALALDERPSRLLGGHLAATLALPAVARVRGIRPELVGRVDRDPADTSGGRARLEAGGRLLFERRLGGLWAGAGAVRPPSGRELGVDVGVGAWRALGPAVVSASVRRRSGGGVVAYEDSLGVDMRRCHGGTYGSPPRPGVICAQRTVTSDLEAAARWRIGRAEVEAGAVARLTGQTAGVAGPRRAWAGGRVAVPLTPAVTALAELRQLPPDVARGLPQRTAASFGLRLRPPAPGARPRPDLVPGAGGPRAVARTPSVIVGPPEPGGVRRVRLVLPGARRVELRGDMTKWTPVTLQHAGAGTQAWEGRFTLAEGVYHFAVRTDGGEWRVPAGVPVVDDGFGGEVGVLVVEPARDGREGGPR